MSVNSIGGTPPQAAAPYNQQSPNKAADGDAKELTTVTTQCKKNHKHDQSCPHTTSTVSAPKAGELGSIVDKQA